MNRKFFFFDIDGTLAVGTPGRQYIPESTKKAIRMLKEQGHFVAIATGRSYAMAVDHMRSLGFEKDLFGLFHQIIKQEDWHRILAFMILHMMSIWILRL